MNNALRIAILKDYKFQILHKKRKPVYSWFKSYDCLGTMNTADLRSRMTFEIFDPDDKCVTKMENLDNYRTFFGIIYTLLAVLSLACLIIVTVTLYVINRTRKILAYVFINFLNITQLIYMLPTFVIVLPCTLTDCQYYTDRITMIFAWPDTFGFYAGAGINCLIALERLSIFLLPSSHKVLEKYAKVWCSIPWLIGIAFLAFTNSITCHKW